MTLKVADTTVASWSQDRVLAAESTSAVQDAALAEVESGL